MTVLWRYLQGDTGGRKRTSEGGHQHVLSHSHTSFLPWEKPGFCSWEETFLNHKGRGEHNRKADCSKKEFKLNQLWALILLRPQEAAITGLLWTPAVLAVEDSGPWRWWEQPKPAVGRGSQVGDIGGTKDRHIFAKTPTESIFSSARPGELSATIIQDYSFSWNRLLVTQTSSPLKGHEQSCV